MRNYDSKIINRLKRSEGQLRGVLNMMEEEKNCVDVVTQLSAVRASIDRIIGLIVAENLIDCVENQMDDGMSKEEKIQQAINLLVKSR
jgi:DNA-binding FrmR family transcriptional regulator